MAANTKLQLLFQKGAPYRLLHFLRQQPGNVDWPTVVRRCTELRWATWILLNCSAESGLSLGDTPAVQIQRLKEFANWCANRAQNYSAATAADVATTAETVRRTPQSNWLTNESESVRRQADRYGRWAIQSHQECVADEKLSTVESLALSAAISTQRAARQREYSRRITIAAHLHVRAVELLTTAVLGHRIRGRTVYELVTRALNTAFSEYAKNATHPDRTFARLYISRVSRAITGGHSLFQAFAVTLPALPNFADRDENAKQIDWLLSVANRKSNYA